MTRYRTPIGVWVGLVVIVASVLFALANPEPREVSLSQATTPSSSSSTTVPTTVAEPGPAAAPSTMPAPPEEPPAAPAADDPAPDSPDGAGCAAEALSLSHQAQEITADAFGQAREMELLAETVADPPPALDLATIRKLTATIEEAQNYLDAAVETAESCP